MICIRGLTKAQVLKALYDRAQPQGLSVFSARPGKLSMEEAQRIISEREDRGNGLYFDYVIGRPIKCDLSRDEIDPRLFDRDAGLGAAEYAILDAQTRPESK